MDQQITDIAAWVFWTHVRKSDFSTTETLIQIKRFEEIWNKEDVLSFLDKLNLKIDPANAENTINLIYNKVNEKMDFAVQNEENIIGTVYFDDYLPAVIPEFSDRHLLQKLRTIYADHIPKEIPKLQKIGKLILRSPLPSVVFTDREQIPRAFLVENTKDALGFDVDLLFHVTRVIPFPDNPAGIKNYVAGIFQIHNYKNSDNLWYQLLPNSNCYETLNFT